MNKESMQDILRRHIEISRDVSKHLMKVGKKETSTIIVHKAEIIDGETTLKTTVTLLPIRRMRSDDSVLVDDDTLLFEMQEDIML